MFGFVKYVVTGAVVVGGFVAGLVSSHSTTGFEIRMVSSVCTILAIVPPANVRAEGRSVIITVPVSTTVPCDTVTGIVNVVGRNINANLSVLPSSGGCVQCAGTVVTEVVVSVAVPGVYNVSVELPGGPFNGTVEVF
jgi:hypothetical protein